MPIAATKHTPAGAAAFAKFFMQTVDWGYATVSGAYIDHYAQPACGSCSNLTANLEKDRRAGNRYIGGRLTIRRVARATTTSANGADQAVIVTVDGTSFERVTSRGKYLSADAAHPSLRFKVFTRWIASRWIVTELEVVV